jgi:arginase
MTTLVLAPTNLGLRPGVEKLGDVLLEHGLLEGLGASMGPRVAPKRAFDARRGQSGLLNADGIAEHALALAGALASILDSGHFALVLGGDDSTLLGPALALARRGRSGLVFLDAHADFCPPLDSPTGEFSDSDLAVVTGHGPTVVGNLEGREPYFDPAGVVQVGRRDESVAIAPENEAFATSRIRCWSLSRLREAGLAAALRNVSQTLAGVPTVWLHMDCDVLDDRVMPAVDYRVPDGLAPDELIPLLRGLRTNLPLAGMTVTIYNPALDPSRAAARMLVEALRTALT